MHLKRSSAATFLTVAAALLVLFPCTALANGSKLVPGDSPEYLWAEYSLIQEGRVPPTNMHPITQYELTASFLGEEIPEAPAVQNDFVFALQPSYIGFNTPYLVQYGTIPSPQEGSLTYLHDRVPALLEIGDAVSIGDWLYGRAVIDVRAKYEMVSGQGSILPWNTATLLSMEFPREGYVSIARPNAYLAAGRMKTGIGYGYFGNTFLNGLAPYYDQVQASYQSKYFRFFYMLSSSLAVLTAQEATAQTTNWDSYNYDHLTFDEPVKTFAYHRAEIRPTDWITVGLGEMDMIGGTSPALMQINPFVIWHNAYTAGSSNVMGSADISVVPFKGLHLFGEFTFDDIALPGGIEPPGSKPSAYAWQAGARYVLPFSKSIMHVVGGEFTHVDPWTYNRWQPLLNMSQRYIKQGGYTWADVSLGFTYGGDLNHYGFYYQAVDRNGLNIQAGYDHLDKGPIYLGLKPDGEPYYADYPDIENSGPWGHGTVEQRDTISASVVYPLPWFNLQFTANGTYSWIKNFKNVEGSSDTMSLFTAGIRWEF